MYLWVLALTSGLMRKVHLDRLLQFCGHTIDGFGFGPALDIEHVDALLDGVFDLQVGLTHAGEDDLLGVAAGRQHAVELAAGHDVKAAARLGQGGQDAHIGVGLHAEADQVVQAFEGLRQPRVVIQHMVQAVDIQGRAMGLGQGLDADVLGVQYALLVRKSAHQFCFAKKRAGKPGFYHKISLFRSTFSP